MTRGLPSLGRQSGQAVPGVVAQACEEVGQVSERIEGQSCGGGNQGSEHGRRADSVVAEVKHPVLAFMKMFP